MERVVLGNLIRTCKTNGLIKTKTHQRGLMSHATLTTNRSRKWTSCVLTQNFGNSTHQCPQIPPNGSLIMSDADKDDEPDDELRL